MHCIIIPATEIRQEEDGRQGEGIDGWQGLAQDPGRKAGPFRRPGEKLDGQEIIDQRQPGSDHVARNRPAMHSGEQNNAVQQGVVVDVSVAAQLPLFLSFFTLVRVAIIIHKNREQFLGFNVGA